MLDGRGNKHLLTPRLAPGQALEFMSKSTTPLQSWTGIGKLDLVSRNPRRRETRFRGKCRHRAIGHRISFPTLTSVLRIRR